MNDQRFIQELEDFLSKDICDACAQNSNPHAKPKPSSMKSALIFQACVCRFLVVGCTPLWSHAKNVVGLRWLYSCGITSLSFVVGGAGSNIVILIPLAKGRKASCIFRLRS